MSRFWSPVVGTLSPYVPGEQPKLQNLVKLNTNEHPYGPSPKVLDAIRRRSDAGQRHATHVSLAAIVDSGRIEELIDDQRTFAAVDFQPLTPRELGSECIFGGEPCA